MTPHSATAEPAQQLLLRFVKGEDGRYRAGPYVLSPATIGFGIEAMDVLCEGIHLHRTVGRRCLVEAEAWANADCASKGNANKGQQALL